MVETFLAPGLGPLTARPIGAGKVFFVSGAGNDNNSGLSPDAPFATIVFALAQCVTGRGDYIYIMSTTTEAAYPVVISKAAVHIIGLSNPGVSPNISVRGGGQQCFSITDHPLGGDYLEIAGIGFGTNTNEGIYAIQSYGTWIHHCAFGGSPLYNGGLLRTGILFDQMPAGLIEDCTFGGGHWTWSRLTGYGITGSGLVNNTIRRNLFMNCDLGAIHSDSANMELGLILDNTIYAGVADAAGALGWAINLEGAGATYGGLIDGNHATQTGDNTAANNPYQDLSTPAALNTARGWGLNYLNDVATDPAV